MNFVRLKIQKNVSVKACLFFLLKVCVITWIVGLVSLAVETYEGDVSQGISLPNHRNSGNYCDTNIFQVVRSSIAESVALCNISQSMKYTEIPEEANKMLEMRELCSTANLNASAYTDIRYHKIAISFTINPEYKNCFEYFYITLEQEYRKVREYKLDNPSKEERFFYTFEDVPCGLYKIIINPCFDFYSCSILLIDYRDEMNMTGRGCIKNFAESSSSKSALASIEKGVIIGLAFASLVITVAVSGLVYRYYWSGRLTLEEKHVVENEPEKSKILTKSIKVYILHFYDADGLVQLEVGNLKDYLLRSSYFSAVNSIEEELAWILFDVNGWLNHILKREDKDGNIQKIILINTGEFEAENYEVENIIYSRFIENLRQPEDPSSLFVVELDGIATRSERLSEIAEERNDRYNIARDSDLKDLCDNLGSVSELNIYNV